MLIIIWRYFLVFSCWPRSGCISLELTLRCLTWRRLYQLLCWNRFTKWSFWLKLIFLSWLLRFLEQSLYFVGVLSHRWAHYGLKQWVRRNIKEWWLRFIVTYYWSYSLICIRKERSAFLRVCGPLFGAKLENTKFFLVWFDPKNGTRMWPPEQFLLFYVGWSDRNVCLFVKILNNWFSFFELLTHIIFCLFNRPCHRFLLKCVTALLISWFILVSAYNLVNKKRMSIIIKSLLFKHFWQ